MTELAHVSYYALRVCPAAPTRETWVAADAHGDEAPAAVRALLAGRTRVELSATEAELAISWASGLPGWDEQPLKPIFVHPSMP
jgi:hypothetical protein